MCKTTEFAVTAAHSAAGDRWQDGFEDLMERVVGRFRRVETRRTARDMVAGLVSELPDKNCWTLSEQAGYDHVGCRAALAVSCQLGR
ncbi:hypothetical protein [Nocardia sp. 2TAF39]|uniref:hypothetical protein n=1 Tax=unclassified Nocardia TaxID=2637762 RepID=UPI003F97901C